MKTIRTKIGFTVILGLLTLLIYQSCNKEFTLETPENSKQEELPKYLYNAYVDDLKLPNGTEVKKIDDSSIEFIYPKGIELWISDENGILSRMAYGGYTCTCSGDNGCDVVYYRGSFGCAHGSCSEDCTGSNSRVSQNQNLTYTFVNTNLQIEPITNDTDFNNLPYLPKTVLQQKEVQEKLQNYALSIYGKNYNTTLKKIDESKSNTSDLNNIVYIQMKMYGFKFIYGIAIKELKPSIYKNNNFERINADHSCNCNSGDSGCEKGSSFGVKYCEGGSCTSCTMTVS